MSSSRLTPTPQERNDASPATCCHLKQERCPLPFEMGARLALLSREGRANGKHGIERAAEESKLNEACPARKSARAAFDGSLKGALAKLSFGLATESLGSNTQYVARTGELKMQDWRHA